MYGKATLQLPKTGTIGPSTTEGLSDEMAMSYGTLFARTLLDEEDVIKVTLTSGSVRLIGRDNLTNKTVIRRSHPNYNPPYRTH